MLGITPPSVVFDIYGVSGVSSTAIFSKLVVIKWETYYFFSLAY
jgi:hypothetical protein